MLATGPRTVTSAGSTSKCRHTPLACSRIVQSLLAGSSKPLPGTDSDQVRLNSAELSCV
jgi:hypothetical protein